jgi:hypothetical protein
VVESELFELAQSKKGPRHAFELIAVALAFTTSVRARWLYRRTLQSIVASCSAERRRRVRRRRDATTAAGSAEQALQAATCRTPYIELHFMQRHFECLNHAVGFDKLDDLLHSLFNTTTQNLASTLNLLDAHQFIQARAMVNTAIESSADVV